MTTDRSQALAALARDLRELERRAREIDSQMLAYMIDMAAIEAEAEVRDEWRSKSERPAAG